MTVTLRHVLWIGGAQGSGKTSIARWLGQRHDLRVYHADAYTYAHHDRAQRGDYPVQQAWAALSPDERWVETDPDAMARLFLRAQEERFRMILDDLGGLPPAPLVVAEGVPLLPRLVREHLEAADCAVWLLPEEGFQRERLGERDPASLAATSDPERARRNRIEREVRVARAVEAEAQELSLPVLPVDGSRDLRTTRAAVEQRFARAIARGPRLADAAERPRLRRFENEAVCENVLAYIRRDAAGGSDERTYPFSCECAVRGCTLQVESPVSDFEPVLARRDRFVVDQRHRAPGEREAGPVGTGVAVDRAYHPSR